MYCMKCSNELGGCTCPDLQERLAALGQSGSVILTYCSGCGEYEAKCRCPHPRPDLEQRHQGKICGKPIKRRYSRLENWSLAADFGDAYRAPEDVRFRLQGNIHDDSRFPEGYHVVTSEFRRLDGEYAITKSGTYYKLGTPDPKWDEMHPGASQKFLLQNEAKRAS